MTAHLLRDVQLLQGPDQPLQRSDVLLEQGVITAIGASSWDGAARLGLSPCPLAPGCWRRPWWIPTAFWRNLKTAAPKPSKAWSAQPRRLATAPWPCCRGPATGVIAPNACTWRLSPRSTCACGGFSLGGRGEGLSAHADLLAAGALGLAEEGELPPLPLLERGLSIGECADRPVLLAPRNASLDHGGFVREGWKPCGRAGPWIRP